MQARELDDGLFRTDCSNGLVVVTERLTGVRSAAAGIWIRSASGHESPEVLGVSHLLEHMVFKGTTSRSALDIATALECRGGSLDAFTSRDHTGYQAHVLDADLPLALDVLTDLVRNPTLRESDLDLERKVVLEEISAALDAPDDRISELFSETLFPSHPYGRPILGTTETVAALGTEDLRKAHSRGYYPGNCVIAVAGNLEHEDVLSQLDRLGWFDGEARPPMSSVEPTTATHSVKLTEHRDLQQVHAMVGTDSFAAGDPRRWAMALTVTTLGGGMSSRLFQKVREELALCYTVYAWHGSYRGGGLFGVYVGTQPGSANQALEAIDAELARISAEGLPSDDLADAKGQLKGQVMLALESTTSRMSRLASHVLNNEAYRPLDEIIRLVDNVVVDDTASVAGEFLTPSRMNTVQLGPFN